MVRASERDGFFSILTTLLSFFHRSTNSRTLVCSAVDQEFRKNVESDPWRLLHVRKALSNPQHPFSLFNTGNLETMKLIDRAQLRVWFDTYYSANLMNLCIVGREPMDVLVGWAEKYFGPVKDVDAGKVPVGPEIGPVFPESLHGNWIHAEPLKDLRELGLTWELPAKGGYVDMDSKPSGLLGHVLGHEGEGSLLSYLKRMLWAEELSAGRSEMGVDNDTFEISVTLTEQGLENVDKVVEAVFAAMERFRSLGSYPEHLYEELNLMGRIGWEYQQRGRGTATSYAGMMRKEKLETFPGKQLLVTKFEPERVSRLLDFLRPERCMVTLVSKEHKDEAGNVIELDRTEQWMGAKFAVRPFSAKQMESWTKVKPLEDVSYPAPNPFIPQELKMVVQPDPEIIVAAAQGEMIEPFRHPPSLLVSDARTITYFAQDDEFFVPQSTAIFHILTPRIRPGSAEGTVLAALYNRFVHERLAELSYPAHYAGLSYDVWIHQSRGLGVSISGYSEKSTVLLDAVLDAVLDPGFNEAQLAVFKESLERGYKNAEKDPPMRQAMDVMSSVLYKDYVGNKLLADAASKVTMDSLKKWTAGLFERVFVEAMVGGNVRREDADGMLAALMKRMGKGTVTPDEVKRWVLARLLRLIDV